MAVLDILNDETIIDDCVAYSSKFAENRRSFSNGYEKAKKEYIQMLVGIKNEIIISIDGGEGSEQFEQGVNVARVQALKIIDDRIDKFKEKMNDKD